YSTGCRSAEIACVGDVRNLRPACTNDILLVLCQDVSSANPRRVVPRVLSRNLELFISSRDPVRTNTGSDRQPLDRMPPVLDIPGIVTSPDIAAQKAIRAIYRLRMENSVTLRNVVWIVESCIFLNDAAMIGIVRRCLVELTRLQVEPTSKLMRPPCLRNVIGGIACNGRFLSRAYRHRREIVQSRKRGALTCECTSSGCICEIHILFWLAPGTADCSEPAVLALVVVRHEETCAELRSPLRDQPKSVSSTAILIFRNVPRIPLIVCILLA